RSRGFRGRDGSANFVPELFTRHHNRQAVKHRSMKTIMAVIAVLVLSAVCIVSADDTAKKTDEVTLKGRIGCASCSYNVSKECAVSFKTDDGKIYTLKKASKELME